MPSFEDIRSRYPGARDLTDEEIIERTAEITKLPLSVVADDFGYTPRTRNPAAFANDTLVTGVNAALGGIKAGADFVSPGSNFSENVGKLIREGEDNQSLPVKLGRERLNQALNTDDIGTQASGVKDFVLQNPIQAASMAAGSFALPLGAIKGFQAGAKALDLGAKAVTRAGTAGGVTAGAVLGGGDAAGDAYEMVYNSPKLANLSPEERDEIATAAARKAQVVPTLIGGASGLFGADKALAAGGTRSILKTAGAEFLSEAVEEGTTKLSANLAASQVDSDIKPMTGVAGASLLGGVLGGGTGLAVGAMTKERPANSFLGGANNTDGSVDDTAINRAIDGNSQPVPVGPIPRSAAYGPNIPEQAGPPAPTPQQQAADAAQLQVQQDQQLQQAAAAKQEEQRAARSEVFRKYGGVESTIPGGTKPMWQYLGKNYFTLESLSKAVDTQVAKEAEKPPLVREVENALTQTYEAVGLKPYTPGKMSSFLAPFTEQAESLEEVAGRIEAEILNSKENTPQSDTLKALRNILLGKPVGEAFGDANPVVEQPGAVAPAPQAVQTKTPDAKQPSQWTDVTQQYLAEQGEANGQLQVQDTAGLGNVPIQGSTTEGSGTVTGDVRPNEVRPIGPGSNALLTDTEQDVPSGTEGTQLVADGSGQRDADVRSEREEARAQVRKIFAELIGDDRDAGILMDLQDTDTYKTQQAVAEKYGVDQSTVSRLTKLLKSDTLGPRFFLAAKKLGISKDEVAYLIAQIEDTGLDQDVNEDTVDDSAAFVNTQASDALPNTNSDDVNPKFSDEADVSKLGNEEVFGNEEDGAGGYAILDSVAGTKLSDASEANKTATKYKKEGSNWSKYEDFEIQNLIADGVAKKSDIPGILEEVKRREAVRVGKEAPTKTETKVTKKATKKVVEKPAVEAKREPVVEAKTSAEAAADAWDTVASKIPDAPLFEELSEEQQNDFISFGPDNWSAADVNTELNKLAPKFSKKAKKDENAWGATELVKKFKALFNSDDSFKDLVTVVDSVYDLDADLQTEVLKEAKPEDVQGFVKDNKVYIIANNITKGTEMSVLLHELGAHVGMKNLIGEFNYKKLVSQVERWASGKGTPIEVKIAKAALKRVEDANVSAAVRQDELLAYFVEEAVLAGINPTATEVQGAGQIIQFLKTLLVSMKLALRKIGFDRFDELTAGNVIDLAFGAAKMELDGTYHGTKAEFRKFSDMRISNVMNGWGHYTTNLRSESKTFGEKTIRALPLLDRKDLIQLDRPLEDQPGVMKKLRAIADVDFQEFLAGLGEQIDGGDLQEELGNYEVNSAGGLYKLLDKESQDRVVDVKEIVSAFLSDYKIPGSTFKPYGRGMPNRQTIVFQGKDVSRVSQQTEDGLKFSIAAARVDTQKRIDRMPKAYRGTVQKMFDFLTSRNLGDELIAAFAFTRDVTARAANAGLKAAQTYQRLYDARKQILGSYSSRIETIIEDFNSLDSVLKGTGEKSVNRFIKDSTTQGKWGFQPSWLPKQVTVDPEMQERFEALEKTSPKAAEIIKAVFKYNYDTNQAMKKSIMESVTSEFDALIAQAKKDGDIVEEARLTKEKAKDLSEFASRLAIRNEKPYAALKRFGNWVIVGKSKAYMDAEDANDQAEIRKLQTDENHYVVQFAETNSEAQAIYRDLDGKYEYLTEPFKSAEAEKDVYGGSDMNGLFYRLRNLVEKDSLDDPVQRGMVRMLNTLHLKLLSEESVRQSENQRKNITGADDDMMRAFVSQGRAAAHFVSSLTNSAGIYESMREMRKERDARTPGKDVRSIYYNEIMKRHGMELNYDPTPVVDAALNVTSTWMLLTSPGYFFQNATQPFLLSLPYMGSNPKFGYTRTANELLKTYGEVKKVVGLGKKGLSEGDYKDLPEDVRGAIEELVNRGSINISLSAELGRFRSEVGADEDLAQKGAALYTKGTDMLRGFAENLESINRLTTAMTAYRMALRSGMSNEASIDYADKVIYNTHGDYSGTNAPRVMRTGAGRIATQFRKFQLIQISLMARLWHEWRKGATPEERIVAKRQLMFTLGHTFAVGGIMGMPGFTALAFLWGALFGDEDEPDNPELTLRRLIGNDDLADLLVKGVPAFMGVDLSGKLGMGQMLSILPYTDFKLTRESMNQATVALIGGPFLGGLVPKAVDGAAYMAAGEYYKGLEKLLPKGLGDAMKGLRIANEGLTNKRGDLQLSADEVTFMDSFLAGLGLPTTTLTDRQFAESTKFQFDEFYNGKTTEIKNAYAKAYRAGDAQGMAEARQKWMDIQQSRVKNGYSRQPLSTLIKAPVEQRKREMNSAGGVGFDRGNRRFVQELTRD